MDDKEVSGYIHRNVNYQDRLITVPEENVRTLYDSLKRALLLYSHKPVLGTRKILDAKGTRGEYEFITYKQMWDRGSAIGCYLRSLGVKSGDKVATYSINREEVTITDAASNQQGFTSISLYDALGENSVEYVLNHAEVVAVVCSREKTPRLLRVAAHCPNLKFIIQMEDHLELFRNPHYKSSEAGKYSEMLASVPHLRLLEYSFCISEGAKLPAEYHPPLPSDLAMILYTSGTTGDPKGVMIPHSAFLSAVSAANASSPLLPDDVHISYLPFAHVYERLVWATGLISGGSVGYYQGDVDKLIDDIQALRPTVFVGVPRVFQRIYDRVQETIKESLYHRRKLFEYAYASKLEGLKSGEPSPWLDALVFSKIRARLGGRVRLIISGSAPLSEELQRFLMVCFGCAVIQGYGLSETCACDTVQLPAECSVYNVGNVGRPTPCNEIKLLSVNDMNYSPLDLPLPRGEIAIRGPNVFAGYYKEEDKTKEVMTEDGFFRTGDIGQWNKDGSLSIIDRKKNIFKLAQGEYVSSEKLEQIYTRIEGVSQIFVYGDSFQNYLVAVVVLEKGKWGELTEEEVRKKLRVELEEIAKKEKLAGFERIKDFWIEKQEFGVENGLLTPTFKLVRGKLKERYINEIGQMYKRSGVYGSSFELPIDGKKERKPAKL